MDVNQDSSLRWPAAGMPASGAMRVAGPRFPVLNFVLFLVTALTMTMTGAMREGVDPTSQFGLVARGLPFGVTLMAILLVHEAGHYLMCVRYGVVASFPYFLPGIPHPLLPGTFGAFIRIRSRFPHRRALFDVGAAGPWAGFVVALAATIVGLSRSTVLHSVPSGPAAEFGDSLLTDLLARLVLHADSSRVVLHPIALAGWYGFFVTSLNLLPVGQLDGGHVLYAAFGRTTVLVPSVLIAALVWLGWTGWSGWVVWAIITTLLMSLGHPSTDDDASPLDPGRRLLALATLGIFLLTFVAEPLRILP